MASHGTITRLRCYKPDGEYLEFIVGEKHTNGEVIGINRHGSTGDRIEFTIWFKKGDYTIVSGFPFTAYYPK